MICSFHSKFPTQNPPRPTQKNPFHVQIKYDTTCNFTFCRRLADEGDSKSLVLITRVGSTPTTGIKKELSQLVWGSFFLSAACERVEQHGPAQQGERSALRAVAQCAGDPHHRHKKEKELLHKDKTCAAAPFAIAFNYIYACAAGASFVPQEQPHCAAHHCRRLIILKLHSAVSARLPASGAYAAAHPRCRTPRSCPDPAR